MDGKRRKGAWNREYEMADRGTRKAAGNREKFCVDLSAGHLPSLGESSGSFLSINDLRDQLCPNETDGHNVGFGWTSFNLRPVYLPWKIPIRPLRAS